LDCPGVQQKLFSQRRFASIWMGDDGKAAATKDFLAWGLGLLWIDGCSTYGLRSDAIISGRIYRLG
jgi:hypothetical protein